MQRVRLLLLVESIAFLTAATIHFGMLSGASHREAGVAETAIGAVLLGGLASSWIRPGWTGRIGLAAQSFALVATLIGVWMTFVGLSPRTAPDLVYLAGSAALLTAGILIVRRDFPGGSRAQARPATALQSRRRRP
jgi:hypothetical protein